MTPPSRHRRGRRLSHVKETTLTIEQHIEELRAELRNAVDPGERRWIAAELELAQTELEVAMADVFGDGEPPF